MSKQAKNELLENLKQQRDFIEHQIATLEREIMLQDIVKKCENGEFYRINRIDYGLPHGCSNIASIVCTS